MEWRKSPHMGLMYGVYANFALDTLRYRVYPNEDEQF